MPNDTSPLPYTKLPLTSNLSNTLLDNSDSFCMAEYVKSVLKDSRCTEAQIATGYWDLPGMKLIYDELKGFLERGGKLQLLLGQEPMLRSYMLEGPQKRDANFPGFYIQRDIRRLNEDFVDVAQLLIDYADAAKSQIEVRVYGKEGEDKFLHAKCYIFSGEDFAKGIIGSSNFTQKGLLENVELNYLETDELVVLGTPSPKIRKKSHLTWFNEKWDEGEPWTGKFIEIIGTTPGRAPKALTPYEVYIRLLQDQFGAIIDENMDVVLTSYLSGTKYTPIDYQLDAVKELYAKMERMGGFLLADVVGLGKTICGVLLLKYYLEHITNRDKKVLIIVPPAIKQSWKDTIDEFNKSACGIQLTEGVNIDFITSGSIEKLVDADLESSQDDSDDDNDEGELDINKSNNYSLILIDESHKFRNSSTNMYKALNDAIDEIWSRTGYYPYVGLISATPQNNQPRDIQNQILLFEHEPSKSHFDRIPNKDFESFFGKINKDYKSIKTLSSTAAKPKLKALAQEVRNKVLESIMVRRTRTDIQTNYSSGLVFPDIVGPVQLDYIMDSFLATAFSNTMNAIGKGGSLQYSRYRAIEELKASKQKPYVHGSMTAKKSADALAGIIQILLVKRLESSFDAFRKSLSNEKKRIENMLQMIADDCIFICPDIDVNAELDIDAKQAKAASGVVVTYGSCYKDIRKHISRLTAAGRNTKGQNAEYNKKDFTNIKKYEANLQADLAIIDGLISDWSCVTTDPKLDEFKRRLSTDLMVTDSVRVANHIAELNKKLSVAKSNNDAYLEAALTDEINRLQNTESKIIANDTLERKVVIFSEAIDTVKRLENECTKLGYRVLAITAANRNQMQTTIQENFDANCAGTWRNDYDILITTEVLAEGINLHRANAIVNYDSPWNATKLIQRIGRVNRIGSVAPAVFVYNFHPSAQGNVVLALVQNAYAKLQSFHIMFGEDNAVFSDSEEVVSYSVAMGGTASPLQPYIQELRDYRDKHKSRYQQIANAAFGQLEISVSSVEIVNANHQKSETLCAIKDVETTFVLVDVAMNATIVPTIEAMEACKCNETASAEDITNVDITAIKNAAMQAYINYKNVLSSNQLKAAIYTNALTAIHDIPSLLTLSPSAQTLLNNVNALVRNGQRWVAKQFVKLYADVQSKSTSAVPYSSADLEDALNDILGKAKTRSITIPNPSHFITFNKQ